MGSITAVGKNSKYRVCPICGKPDWCGVIEFDGYTMLACQRTKDHQNTIGADGLFYVFVKESKSGASCLYEEANQARVRKGDVDTDSASYKAFEVQKVKSLPAEELVPALPNSKLHKIYSKMLSMLVLEERHKQYLLSEGWSEELIKASGIKSFPVNDYERNEKGIVTKNPKRYELGKALYEAFGDLTGVPGAYAKVGKNDSIYWTFAGPDGILFPIADINKQIYRLRIRLENPTKNMKYGNLSSFKKIEKEGKLINYYKNGTRSGNAIGMYQNNCLCENDYYIAYVTEGEKKGIIGNYILKSLIIDIPGVNSFALLLKEDEETGERIVDSLKRKGVKILIIAFDADKSQNEAVLKAEQHTIKLLKNEGFIIGIANWPISWGKGLDDILVKGYRPTYDLAK